MRGYGSNGLLLALTAIPKTKRRDWPPNFGGEAQRIGDQPWPLQRHRRHTLGLPALQPYPVICRDLINECLQIDGAFEGQIHCATQPQIPPSTHPSVVVCLRVRHEHCRLKTAGLTSGRHTAHYAQLPASCTHGLLLLLTRFA